MNNSRLARTIAALVAASIMLTSAAPIVASQSPALPERVPIPEDNDHDGVPEPLESILSVPFCDRAAVRDAFNSASASVGGQLGRCEGVTWIPPASKPLTTLTIPDPRQDPQLVATPVDNDADGAPGSILVRVKMLRVTIDSTGAFTYQAAPDHTQSFAGNDPDGCDCMEDNVAALFVRNTDGDADSDFAELTGADPTTNPTWFTAVADGNRTLSDPDGDGFSSQQEIQAQTNPDDVYSHPNRAPTITVSPLTPSVNENAEVVVTATATDRDPRFTDPSNTATTAIERARGPPADVPTVSCTGPNGLSNTGEGSATIRWTPTFADGRPSAYAFTCTARDHGMQLGGTGSAPLEASSSGAVTVVDVNDRPTVDITLPTASINEGATASLAFVAADAGPNATSFQNLSIQLVNAPSWATINAAKNAIDLSPGFLTVAHPNANLVATLKIRVSDGATPVVEDTVTVTVVDVNQAPTGSLTPAVPSDGSYDVNENAAMTPITFTVADADGDALSCSAPIKPSGSTLTGCTLTWTPGFTAAGLHPVELRATDGIAAPIVTTFNINVTNTNRVPVLTIPAGAFTTVPENTASSFTLDKSDPDGTPLTLSLVGSLPSWAGFDPVAGVFNVSPGHDVIGPFPETIKEFTVTFQADDGEGQTVVAHRFNVTNVNRLPTITATPVASIDEAQPLSVTFTIADPDNDQLTLTAPTLPASASLDANTRTVTWTPSQDYVDHSGSLTRNAAFAVRVADGHGGNATLPFTVSVNDVNRAPVFALIPAQSVSEGATLTFTPTATDADGDAVTIAKTAGDGTFNGTTLAYAPGFTEVVHPATTEAHSATFRVTDNFGGAQTMTVAITVNDVNRAPSATLQGVFRPSMIIGETSGTFSADVVADCAGSADLDVEDVLTCTFVWGDNTTDNVTNTAGNARHTYSMPGARKFDLYVRDGAGGEATLNRTFRVYNGSADNDVDDLTNREELTGSRNTLFGFEPTNPDNKHSDEDVDEDGDEIVGGSDPNNKRSTRADRDGDGIPNGVEAALYGRTGMFDPDGTDDPVPGGVPLYGSQLLYRADASDATSAHLRVWYDRNANGIEDGGDMTVLDTDMVYTVDVATGTIRLFTTRAGATSDTVIVVEDDEQRVTITTPDGQTRVVAPDVAGTKARAEAAKAAIEACLAETGPTTANTNADAKPVCDNLATARAAVAMVAGEVAAAKARAEAAKAAIDACLAETGPTTANTNADADPVCEALAEVRKAREAILDAVDDARLRAEAAKAAIEACLAETGPTTANTNADAKSVCDTLATARGAVVMVAGEVAAAKARAEAAKAAIEACLAETGPTTANTNADAKPVCDNLAAARGVAALVVGTVEAAKARAEAAKAAIEACAAETGPTTANTNADAKPVCDNLATARATAAMIGNEVAAAKARAEAAKAAIEACAAETGPTTANTNADAKPVCDNLATARGAVAMVAGEVAAAKARAEAAKAAIDACLAETGPTTANTNPDADPVCKALAAARDVPTFVGATRARAEAAKAAIEACAAETGPTTANTNADAKPVCDNLATARATAATVGNEVALAKARAEAAKAAIDACLAETGPTTANTNIDAKPVCDNLATARGAVAMVAGEVAAAKARAEAAKAAIDACLAETGPTTANTNNDAKPVCDALATARATATMVGNEVAAAKARAEAAKAAIDACVAETGPTTANTNADAKAVCDTLATARGVAALVVGTVEAAKARAEAAKAAIEACVAETGPTTANTNADAKPVCDALATARATAATVGNEVAAAKARAEAAKAAIEACAAETGPTTANTNADAKPVCDNLATARATATMIGNEVALAKARAEAAKAAIEACLAETGPTTANTNNDAKPVCDNLATARATATMIGNEAAAAKARAEAAKAAVEACAAETGPTTANTNADAKPVCDNLAAARGHVATVRALLESLDTDNDKIPDQLEPVICRIDGSGPEDGTCNGDNYTPPSLPTVP